MDDPVNKTRTIEAATGQAILDPAELDRLLGSYRLAQAVYALAVLGIPDLLAAGPSTAAELASATRCHQPSLSRLLRALASEGVLTLDGTRYGLTPASRRLAAGAAGSIRSMLLGWRLLPEKYGAFASLADTVRTGDPAFEQRYGAPFHDYLDAHPDAAGAYESAMESTTEEFATAAGAYDFSGVETVVDVGGGQGAFLVAILRRNPGVRGMLFDLPRVVAGAPARLAGIEEGNRIDIIGGNLFDSLPEGGDIYLFSTVLRCFDDDACIAVLQHCRSVMAPRGRILVFEMVRTAGPWTSPAGLSDLDALVVYGGADRTDVEWETILNRSGLEFTALMPLDEPYALIEAQSR